MPALNDYFDFFSQVRGERKAVVMTLSAVLLTLSIAALISQPNLYMTLRLMRRFN
jgi:hypothetical protein